MARMILEPVITEKSLQLAASRNVYVFRVDPELNKQQIADKIASLYDVSVEWVRTAMRQPQQRKTGKRRLPATIGRVKKAYVRLQEGQTIALFDFATQETA